MNERVKRLTEEIRKLSPEERADLVDELILAYSEPDSGIDKAWAAEARSSGGVAPGGTCVATYRGGAREIRKAVKFEITAAAELELDEAVRYYNQQRTGLGDDFVGEVRRALSKCWPGRMRGRCSMNLLV